MKEIVDKHIKEVENWFAELDRKYPNRHKEIHKVCCKNCPSSKSYKDPETESYKSLPKEVLAKEYVFVCAWRNSKLCKGICDEYNIDEKYLESIT